MKCLVITLLTVCTFAVSSTLRCSKTINNIQPVRHRTQDESQCVTAGSDGADYRGRVSVTARGHRCLRWNRFHNTFSQLGSHNYCRNPDNSSMPWCRVKRRGRIVREFCDIPKCEVKPTPDANQIPLEPETRNQDTETTCGERPQINSFRRYKIVGGLRSSVESQPWMASIFKGQGFKCGGTLIAPCWVLTAAHCFPEGERTSVRRYSVYLGKNAINETDLYKEQKFTISKRVLHQDYDFTKEDFNNDIALLQIVDSSGQCAERTHTVRTACLPPPSQMMPSGTFCTVAGYGRENSNSLFYSRFLKEAQVRLISHSVCQRDDYYGKHEIQLTNNMICAASPTWRDDACQGDSGGPLLCEVNERMFLFGIVSWGDQCATPNKPGVYTKVTNYNSWIAEHTGLTSFTTGIMYPHKA